MRGYGPPVNKAKPFKARSLLHAVLAPLSRPAKLYHIIMLSLFLLLLLHGIMYPSGPIKTAQFSLQLSHFLFVSIDTRSLN